MKILVVNQFGQNQVFDVNSIPQIGSLVDMFYKPYPTVSAVLMWPSLQTLDDLNAGGIAIEAIVTVC